MEQREQGEQTFRTLNALVHSQAQRDRIKTSLLINGGRDLDARYNGFFLFRNRVMYNLPNHAPIQLLMDEREMSDALSKEYRAWGTGKGQNVFYKFMQAKYLGLTRAATTDFLKGQAQYVLSRKAPHRVNRPIVAYEKNELWAIDLIDMWHDDDNTVVRKTVGRVQFKTSYRYIMTVIDVFSRRIWLETTPFKQTEQFTAPAFAKILDRAATQPRHLMMDQGAEFKGAFVALLKRKGIKARRVRSHTPQANGIVEAENAQVRRVLAELWLQNRNRTWWNLLPTVEALRNDSYRTLLKSTANQVYSDNPANLSLKIDVQNHALQRLHAFNETDEFEVGDRVLVTMATVYSHIRAIVKQGNSKKLAIQFFPRVLVIAKVMGSMGGRRRYALREANPPFRFLSHWHRGSGRFTVSYVYASQIARCAITQNQINITVPQALRINQAHETRTDIVWHDYWEEPDYFG